MTPRRGAAALLLLVLALALPACGTQDAEPTAERSAKITVADLSVMVVPQEELGAVARGLRVRHNSGPTSNLDAADDTLDPDDTAKSLTAAGRVAGYDLDYQSPEGTKGDRLVQVGTTAELFKDPVYATQYLSKQVSDVDRLTGKVVEGVRIVGVRGFDAVAVGEEASGMHIVASVGKQRAHVTVVYFRRGRLVGQAWEIRRNVRAVDDEVERIALTLDTRMRRVLTGQLEDEPVPLPGKPKKIDPRPFVLTPLAFPAGTTVAGQGYRQASDVRAFHREFTTPDGMLGASRVGYLSSAAYVSLTASDSNEFIRNLEQKRVTTLVARAFLRGAVRSKVTDLQARPFTVPGRDTAGADFTFDLAGEPLKAVVVYVRSGRVVGSLIALGPSVRTSDVVSLIPEIRARLRSGH